MLWLEPIDVEPAQTVPLRLYRRDGLGGLSEIPSRCVSRWRLADSGVASVSADGALLLINAEAPHGARTSVTANVGAQSVAGELNVYRPEAAPLVGLWRQSEAECGERKPIAELVFSADGRYSVTWIPFETYKDYWGRFRYEAATGALELTVEGGNYMPADVASGAIALKGDAFTAEGASFGSPANGPGCAAPFHRAR